jgi:hypothetical protein
MPPSETNAARTVCASVRCVVLEVLMSTDQPEGVGNLICSVIPGSMLLHRPGMTEQCLPDATQVRKSCPVFLREPRQ